MDVAFGKCMIASIVGIYSRGMDLSLVFIIKDVYLIVCVGLLVGKTYILDKHEKLIEDIYGKVSCSVILRAGLAYY